jgi:hypothetical protein
MDFYGRNINLVLACTIFNSVNIGFRIEMQEIKFVYDLEAAFDGLLIFFLALFSELLIVKLHDEYYNWNFSYDFA